jgi:hypothetical protein
LTLASLLRGPKRSRARPRANEKSRKRHFKPAQVRKTLEKLDGFTGKRRAAAYDLLSQHAAHVNPQGLNVISPDNFTRIGPFVSEPALMALLQELTPHLQLASAYKSKALS